MVNCCRGLGEDSGAKLTEVKSEVKSEMYIKKNNKEKKEQGSSER